MSFPVVVLLSGGGTTLQNLLDKIAAKTLDIDIVHVISSRKDAYGIERAKKAGIPATVIERKGFANAEEFGRANFDICRQAGAKLAVLAGYLQLLRIPEDFTHKVMNIHPSLLPAFGGKGMYGHHVHEAVTKFGAKVTGCTVHFADNEFDHGPIISQSVVTVFPTDTPEIVADRVFVAECEAYPKAIAAFAAGKMEVVGRLVRWTGG
ncbi:phosphoribosylglycinamide formyltransferase [Zavarzinella formosa]|uniref:phosphoribosylglycinamide formyltransferase n=1 Tax=Zavarzinella formosa TaxID=360055 RepID=UPI000305AB45|nr:phosphoribosylglycinamide formyltransferase [Zavarzinella formosa]